LAKRESENMNSILSLALLFVLCPIFAFADTVILKNGKPIKAERAWAEGNKIYFYLQGLKLNILKEEVVRIVKTQDSSRVPAAKMKKKAIPQTAKQNQPTKNKKSIKKKQPATKLPSDAKLRKPSTSRTSDGFRDLDWGVEMVNADGFEEIKANNGLDGVKEYVRSNQSLKIGEVNIKSIVYSFWRNKLYTITIWTQGQSNYMALRKEVFKQFGRGRRCDQSHERHIWSDGPTDRMLEFLENDQHGMFWMRSKKLHRKYKLSQIKVPSSYLKAMEANNLR
jgi:hypothetical protein